MIFNSRKKRNFFITIFFLFLFVNFVSCFEISSKSEFDRGETFFAIVSGNFLDRITTNNVFFYRDGYLGIPIEKEVKEINGDYYISALLKEKIPGDYSFRIEGVRYKIGFDTLDQDIIMDFKIKENWTDFYIEPIFSSPLEDFYIEITNLNRNKISPEIKFSEFFELKDNNIELLSGETKKINFLINRTDSFLEKINISYGETTYSVFVFLNKTYNFEQEIFYEKNFNFEPREIIINEKTNVKSRKIIYLINKGEKDEKNISLYLSPELEKYVYLEKNKLDSLKKNFAEQIILLINSSEEELFLKGEIIANFENFSISSDLILNFSGNYSSEQEKPETNYTQEDQENIITSCIQLGGRFCLSDEKCDVGEVLTRDGYCCLGECIEIKTGNTGKIIGWFLIILVVILLFYFFKKYKKVRPKFDISKITKEKTPKI